jgi:hypothetical protein
MTSGEWCGAGRSATAGEPMLLAEDGVDRAALDAPLPEREDLLPKWSGFRGRGGRRADTGKVVCNCACNTAGSGNRPLSTSCCCAHARYCFTVFRLTCRSCDLPVGVPQLDSPN